MRADISVSNGVSEARKPARDLPCKWSRTHEFALFYCVNAILMCKQACSTHQCSCVASCTQGGKTSKCCSSFPIDVAITQHTMYVQPHHCPASHNIMQLQYVLHDSALPQQRCATLATLATMQTATARQEVALHKLQALPSHIHKHKHAMKTPATTHPKEKQQPASTGAWPCHQLLSAVSHSDQPAGLQLQGRTIQIRPSKACCSMPWTA